MRAESMVSIDLNLHSTFGDTANLYKGTSNTIHQNNVDLNITGFERRKISKSFTCSTAGNTNFVVGSNYNVKAVSNVNIHTESGLNMDSSQDTTIDTPTKFLVGSGYFPNLFIFFEHWCFFCNFFHSGMF